MDIINQKNLFDLFNNKNNCKYCLELINDGIKQIDKLIIETNFITSSFIDFSNIKLIDTKRDIDLPLFENFDKIKSFILIIDFPKIGGGVTFFLNTILTHYKSYNTFVIIRNYNNKYIITVNDEYILNFDTIFDFLIKYKSKITKIFINHIQGHTFDFINSLKLLNKEITLITHDFSLIYHTPQPMPFEFEKITKYDINTEFDINMCQNIFVQNTQNLNIFSNFIKNDKIKIIESELPDFKYSDTKIDFKNEKIIIGIIGQISNIKGLDVLKILYDYYKDNSNIEFIVFGTPLGNEFKSHYYNTINDLNNFLITYKPNLLLELSLWYETYSYTLTLGMLTQLPILCLKKNTECVVENRLNKYNNTHYFSNVKQFDDLIHNVKQDYLYTINRTIYYNHCWDEYFIKT